MGSSWSGSGGGVLCLEHQHLRVWCAVHCHLAGKLDLKLFGRTAPLKVVHDVVRYGFQGTKGAFREQGVHMSRRSFLGNRCGIFGPSVPALDTHILHLHRCLHIDVHVVSHVFFSFFCRIA